MPRPKGSRNKKTLLNEGKLDKRVVAQIDTKITAQQELMTKLAGEEQKLLAEIDAKKLELREKRKEIRAAERAIASLTAEREKAIVVAEAAGQKKEIEKAVTALVTSGVSPEEILEKLKS